MVWFDGLLAFGRIKTHRTLYIWLVKHSFHLIKIPKIIPLNTTLSPLLQYCTVPHSSPKQPNQKKKRPTTNPWNGSPISICNLPPPKPLHLSWNFSYKWKVATLKVEVEVPPPGGSVKLVAVGWLGGWVSGWLVGDVRIPNILDTCSCVNLNEVCHQKLRNSTKWHVKDVRVESCFTRW